MFGVLLVEFVDELAVGPSLDEPPDGPEPPPFEVLLGVDEPLELSPVAADSFAGEATGDESDLSASDLSASDLSARESVR
jgi:hypothetical protein